MNSTPTTPQQAVKNLLVYVRTPEQVVYEGEATSVSSVNKKGPFDVLMQHENFITIITEKVTLYTPKGEKKEFPIRSGVLKAESNRIYVFLGIQDVIQKGSVKK